MLFGVEYPGYGLAKGQPISESSIDAAAETALRYLGRELAVPRERTVLMGYSLGTGVAAAVAQRGFGARLVLPVLIIHGTRDVDVPFERAQ